MIIDMVSVCLTQVYVIYSIILWHASVKQLRFKCFSVIECTEEFDLLVILVL